jgi:hypothetical protein
MEGMRPDLFVFDEVGGTADAIDDTADTVQEGDRCSVPDCGHPESVHRRSHCTVCHAVGHGPGAPPQVGLVGLPLCLHWYFPPKEES